MIIFNLIILCMMHHYTTAWDEQNTWNIEAESIMSNDVLIPTSSNTTEIFSSRLEKGFYLGTYLLFFYLISCLFRSFITWCSNKFLISASGDMTSRWRFEERVPIAIERGVPTCVIDSMGTLPSSKRMDEILYL